MNRIFQQTYHVAGTLSANLAITFKMPCDAQLLHASAVGSNGHDATLTIGDSSDADEYLAAGAIGDSHSPAEFDADDWLNSSGSTDDPYYPHLSDGDIIKIAVDYDGDGGTAIDDFTLVLTFAEG